MKQTIFNNVKNLTGWKTSRKLVVFSVDDYGNLRVDSKEARKNLDKQGLKAFDRFDIHDTLETRGDLEMLFETLISVRDINGKNPVFTAYSVPCNINFETMAENDYTEYVYEKLPVTFKKMALRHGEVYDNTWEIWKQGMDQNLIKPQFHGREHFNLKVFKEKLNNRDKEVLESLKNNSYTSISNTGYSSIIFSESFAFWDFNDIKSFPEILSSGLQEFYDVFGYRAEVFTPPAQQFPKELESQLRDYGLISIDKPFIHKRHIGEAKYKYEHNTTKFNKENDLSILVRNVVFEPNLDTQTDWVDYTLKQIEAAFRWNKPANISTHRLNFSGFVSESNRYNSLKSLKKLLFEIKKRWKDVEFISANELAKMILPYPYRD